MDSTGIVGATDEEKESQPWPVWVRVVLTALLIALSLFAVVSGFALQWGSYSLAWAYLSEKRVVVPPAVVALDPSLFTQELYPMKLAITNTSDRSIKVIGQNVSCRLISKAVLPVEISVGEDH